MVSCYEVIAVNEVTLEDGNTYDICVSPNDVPGYDKEQYMDPEVLAQSPPAPTPIRTRTATSTGSASA